MSRSRKPGSQRLPLSSAGVSPHVLSFDVEEYFQVEAAAEGGVTPDQWHAFEKRLTPCVERILQLLDEHAASATFFVLGWVARHEKQAVRLIADAGHEIASHGMTHTMLGRLTPEQFRGELVESRALLEDLSGRPVIGYRAATFSITHQTAWAIDVLAETGYLYDSSIFPVRHDRYGVPDAPTDVHRAVGPGGGGILEIPPLTLGVMSHRVPLGGGGYLRLLPVRLIGRALRAAERRGRPGMIYLHPWELDPGQPALPMGPVSRWRHRVNLQHTQRKLQWLLSHFRFVEAGELLETLNRQVATTHRYGNASRVPVDHAGQPS